MQNKKPIILIILGVTAFFILWRVIFSGKPPIRRNEITEAARMVNPTQRHAKKTNFTEWGRDPFLPKGAAPSASGLTGIIWDEKSPKALINDAIVGVGDKVGNNTVVKIEKDRVILNDGNKDFELKLE
jgi:hypothetical protein